MHTLSPVQLRHLAFKDPLSVLTRAQLLLCFGFFAAEVGKVGFRLGQWHHAPCLYIPDEKSSSNIASELLFMGLNYGLILIFVRMTSFFFRAFT